MPRKKPTEPSSNHERWLISYADFITLLFAFFVVMFATSQTDKGKAQQVSDSVKKALAGEKMSAVIWSVLGGTVSDTGKGNAMLRGPGGAQKVRRGKEGPEARRTDSLLEDPVRGAQEGDCLRADPDQHAASRAGGELHAGGAVSVRRGRDFAGAYDGLEKVAAAITQIPNPMRLEGHTDSVPIRTPRDSAATGSFRRRAASRCWRFSRRASACRARRMSIAGYADTAPIASNETEEGRARNRRVDIVILNEFGVVAEPAKP